MTKQKLSILGKDGNYSAIGMLSSDETPVGAQSGSVMIYDNRPVNKRSLWGQTFDTEEETEKQFNNTISISLKRGWNIGWSGTEPLNDWRTS